MSTIKPPKPTKLFQVFWDGAPLSHFDDLDSANQCISQWLANDGYTYETSVVYNDHDLVPWPEKFEAETPYYIESSSYNEDYITENEQDFRSLLVIRDLSKYPAYGEVASKLQDLEQLISELDDMIVHPRGSRIAGVDEFRLAYKSTVFNAVWASSSWAC